MTRKDYLICLILSVSLALLASCSTPKTDPIIDKQLARLMESKNYFKLRAELEKVKDKLSEDRLLYYQACCNNVFDKCEESNKNIETLLSKYSDRLSDTAKKDMLIIKSMNSVRLYKYKDAIDAYDIILSKYANILDDSNLEDLTNARQLFGALVEVKPQLIHKHGDIEIKGYRDQFNLLRVPVQSGGIDDDFVFDSGANLSTISQSHAKKMGLIIYESDINVNTATHIIIKTKLAVADKIYVGDLLFENVVFLVTPDETMSFPELDYKINGVIGFPMIHQMEEIRLRGDGSIFIPQQPQNKPYANMCMVGLSPLVQVISSSDTLVLNLDTGAVETNLSKRYFVNHRKEVENNGRLIISEWGGAGGAIETEVYEIENFPFTIGSKSGVLEKIFVNTEDFDYTKKSDGNMGQDIITQFNELVLNFKYMYLDFN